MVSGAHTSIHISQLTSHTTPCCQGCAIYAMNLGTQMLRNCQPFSQMLRGLHLSPLKTLRLKWQASWEALSLFRTMHGSCAEPHDNSCPDATIIYEVSKTETCHRQGIVLTSWNLRKNCKRSWKFMNNMWGICCKWSIGVTITSISWIIYSLEKQLSLWTVTWSCSWVFAHKKYMISTGSVAFHCMVSLSLQNLKTKKLLR